MRYAIRIPDDDGPEQDIAELPMRTDVNPQPATGTTAGIKRGDLAGTIQAIMNGDTYVNVHTTKYPDGEIRGQIQAGK